MYTYRWNHRMIFINQNLSPELLRLVVAHELGHDARHRQLAGSGLRELPLFRTTDTTEYEANAFAAHLLLENEEVLSLAREGYDAASLAKTMGTDVNLMLIKLQELNRLGYELRLPCPANGRFLKKVSPA